VHDHISNFEQIVHFGWEQSMSNQCCSCFETVNSICIGMKV